MIPQTTLWETYWRANLTDFRRLKRAKWSHACPVKDLAARRYEADLRDAFSLKIRKNHEVESIRGPKYLHKLGPHDTLFKIDWCQGVSDLCSQIPVLRLPKVFRPSRMTLGPYPHYINGSFLSSTDSCTS